MYQPPTEEQKMVGLLLGQFAGRAQWQDNKPQLADYITSLFMQMLQARGMQIN